MPATACPNSRMAAVICSGVKTAAAEEDGANAEAVIAPVDGSAIDDVEVAGDGSGGGCVVVVCHARMLVQ